jgi:hypothetical protein
MKRRKRERRHVESRAGVTAHVLLFIPEQNTPTAHVAVGSEVFARCDLEA